MHRALHLNHRKSAVYSFAQPPVVLTTPVTLYDFEVIDFLTVDFILHAALCAHLSIGLSTALSLLSNLTSTLQPATCFPRTHPYATLLLPYTLPPPARPATSKSQQNFVVNLVNFECKLRMKIITYHVSGVFSYLWVSLVCSEAQIFSLAQRGDYRPFPWIYY